MTAKELIESLSKVAPDTEIVGGMWNGRMDTYKVLDELHVFLYNEIFADFYRKNFQLNEQSCSSKVS